jgi:hypothetical protein
VGGADAVVEALHRRAAVLAIECPAQSQRIRGLASDVAVTATPLDAWLGRNVAIAHDLDQIATECGKPPPP